MLYRRYRWVLWIHRAHGGRGRAGVLCHRNPERMSKRLRTTKNDFDDGCVCCLTEVPSAGDPCETTRGGDYDDDDAVKSEVRLHGHDRYGRTRQSVF
jgi:hypothetical protein